MAESLFRRPTNGMSPISSTGPTPPGSGTPRPAPSDFPRGGERDDEIPEDALSRFEQSGEEFIDLPPGALLREWRVGPWSIAWSLANLIVAAGLLAAWLAGGADALGPSPQANWAAVARLLGVLVRTSSRLCLVVFVFQVLVGAREPRRPLVTLVASSSIALLLESVREVLDPLAFGA